MAHKGQAGPALFRRDLSMPAISRPWRFPIRWRWSTGMIQLGGTVYVPGGRYISQDAEVDEETGDITWRIDITVGPMAGNYMLWRLPMINPLDDRVADLKYFRPSGLWWHVNMGFPQTTNGRIGGTGTIIFDAPPTKPSENRIFEFFYGLWGDEPGTYTPG